MNSVNGQNKLVALEAPFSKETAKVLNNYPSVDGYLLKLFRMWANSPRLLSKFGASSLLDGDSPLALKVREIIILRITALEKCEYEWGVHVSVFRKKAELTNDQLKDTLNEIPDSKIWNSKELLAFRVVDSLHQSSVLSTSLKAEFQKEYTQKEQLEVFALCGFYKMVALTANNSEIGLEQFAARFDDI